ncbi:hypothetical protein GPECTOR_376g167 [Gonium pectorale]|uniref:Pherophorin domain-containing protein n=1 Tax=Gonium pectorale TaxID=33097 RepID=A0A150FX27_GONPE|nr:hypothetical protein GPECTOR_376g167 [Gonium pectorale]|eukprot:KXZ41590.1 hypothetical protein GPECTOR_376g167 [Gonium pectorale]
MSQLVLASLRVFLLLVVALLLAGCNCQRPDKPKQQATLVERGTAATVWDFAALDSNPIDCQNVTNSEFNPHPRPSVQSVPWFEGWYARVTDGAGGRSLGIGIGHFPGQQANLSNPAVACFLLVSTGANETLRVYSRNFDSLIVDSPALTAPRPGNPSAQATAAPTSRVDGGAAGPGSGAPVSFSLEASDPDSRDFCSWRVTQGSVRVEARLGTAHLHLRSAATACAAADPWGGPDAPAPEGWLARLGFLLRLQWDVLTLRTAVQYDMREAQPTPLPDDGGSNAPFTGREPASLVVAGGLLPHVFQPLVPPLRQYILSYHPPPPAAPFALDPRNPPLFSSLVVRGCDGLFSLDLYSLNHVVRLVASAAPHTFQRLPCPTGSGFKNYSVESFSALLQLRVLRRPFPLAPPASATLLFEDTFEGAAMEFGGAYVCPEAMPQLRGDDAGGTGAAAGGAERGELGAAGAAGSGRKDAGGALGADGSEAARASAAPP